MSSNQPVPGKRLVIEIWHLPEQLQQDGKDLIMNCKVYDKDNPIEESTFNFDLLLHKKNFSLCEFLITWQVAGIQFQNHIKNFIGGKYGL